MKTNMVQENLMDSATRKKLAGRVEVLGKVKELFLLPQLDMMTTQQVADYYEVGVKAIQSCFYDNRDEIREDGVVKYTPKMLKNLNLLKGETEKTRYVTEIKLSDDVTLRVPNAGINLFSKRAVLRIGMLLRDSSIAREVRSQLLNAFEKTDDAKKIEDIETEQEAMGEMGLAFVAGDIVEFCKACMKYNSFKQRHIDRLTAENAALVEDNSRLAETNREQEAKIREDAPKVEYAEALGSCKGTISVGTFAKSLYGYCGIEIGRNRMFAWMRDHQILDSKNEPYQKYIDQGWFTVSIIPKPGIGEFSATRITPKGQEKLFEMIRSEMREYGLAG